MKRVEREHNIILAFKEGILWNYTFDEETAQDWLDEGQIECYGWYKSKSHVIEEGDIS